MFFLLCMMFGTGADLDACDTWVALKNATGSDFVLFGKNSDRPLFDCQPLVFYARKKWPADAQVNLGRIKIPQAPETYATIGSSPYWCWGYEEGINEFGVVIGNEGVSSKALVENKTAAQNGKAPEFGPTGMDLIRFALERAKTARRAVDVITGLVEKYGQFGSGRPTEGTRGAYDNSYIIADAEEAYVLETAGKHWAAKRFKQGATSISNALTIETGWDLASKGMVNYALEKGWWPKDKKKSFNFKDAYNDDTPANIARTKRACTRAGRSAELLKEKAGQVDIPWMKSIARDRGTSPSIDLNQTAGSCVVELPGKKDRLPVFWWCAAVPSSGCYVPFFVHGSKLPGIVSTAGTFGKVVEAPRKVKQDSFSAASYWWLFRDLSDKVNEDRDKRLRAVRKEFNALEKEFAAAVPGILEKAVALRKAGKFSEAAAVLDNYTAACVDKVVKKVNELRKRFEEKAEPVPTKYKPYVGIYIANFGPFKDAKMKMKVKNGRLTIAIPGRATMELKDPDDNGLWYVVRMGTTAFSFDRDKQGEVTDMNMIQVNQLVKKAVKPGSEEEKAIQKNVPEKYKPYVGDYINFTSTVVFRAFVKEDSLVLDYRSKDIIPLNPPNEKGWRYFTKDKRASVTFVVDKKNGNTVMKLFQEIKIPREK